MKKTEQVKKIKSQKIETLISSANKLRNDLVKLQMEVSFGKSKNVSKINDIKKEIARINTVINENIEKTLE